MLRMAKRFKDPGKKFVICSLIDPVRAIMTMSGFEQLISIAESQAKAISVIKNG